MLSSTRRPALSFAKHFNALCKRYESTEFYQLSPQQASALDAWTKEVARSERLHEDCISAHKLEDLYCTLPTQASLAATHYAMKQAGSVVDTSDVDAAAPGKVITGAPLHPLHSFIYFHARTPEARLGADQTDTDFCPPLPFARRMWAGGAFRSLTGTDAGAGAGARKGSGLRVGQLARANARVERVEVKGVKRGSPMVFVHQRVGYRSDLDEEDVLEEKRIHVYLPVDRGADVRAIREVPGLPEPKWTFSWTPTPTTLFRFSALTWNAHLIHLDARYAREEEGYPERLVHGPLTALMLIENLYESGYRGRIDNFEYRAWNPVVVGRRQYLHATLNDDKSKATLWAEDDDGVVGMTGNVDLVDRGLFRSRTGEIMDDCKDFFEAACS